MKVFLLAITALIAVLLLATAVLIAWPAPAMPNVGRHADVLIRNVAVIDVERGTVRLAQDVALADGRIVSISASTPSPPDGKRVTVDGTGKYLMPGLWDMHTHSLKVAPQYMHPLFIANGVTGVRDMSGCMSEPDSFFACIEDRRAWNEQLARRTGLSPRYVLQSSFQVNGGNEVPDGFPDFFRARTLDEVRRLVAYYKLAGADFLKTYTELSPATYRLLARQSREQGLALAGHRPFRVSLEEVLRSGQQSIEHPRLFLLECFAGSERFRALPNPLAAFDAELQWRLIDQHDGKRCAELMRLMAASETWWTPTLQVVRMGALAADATFRSDLRLKYVPFIFEAFVWNPDADRAAEQPPDASGRKLNAAIYRMALEHVGQAKRAGVKILAGTDAGDTYVFPGFAIHDELVELVGAGLSPAEALRSATLNAAEFAGLQEDFGSVTVGKAGDMLLLDANPLANVAHSQQIAGLFFNGQYFDRAALDELLGFAERQAGSPRANLHLLWDAIRSPLFRMQIAD
jgi:hypothetical protein